MLLEIIWNGETTPVDLVDGTVKVGGGPEDDIHLDGLPHGLLTLELDGGRATVRALRSVRIGKALFPAHVPRLVMPGEALQLPNDVVLRVPPDARASQRKTVGTAAVAKELLAGGLDFAPQHTRAATLTCLTGLDAGTTYPLAFAEHLIGRNPDVEVRVRDMAVSRRHARVARFGKALFIEHLGGPNGVFVNGQKLAGKRQLESGDVVELGHTLLRYDGPERAPEELTVAVSVTERSPVRKRPAEQTGSATQPLPPPGKGGEAAQALPGERAAAARAPAGEAAAAPEASVPGAARQAQETGSPAPGARAAEPVQPLPPAAPDGRPSDEVTLEDESTETAPAPRPRRRVPVDLLLIVAGALVAVVSFAVTLAVLR